MKKNFIKIVLGIICVAGLVVNYGREAEAKGIMSIATASDGEAMAIWTEETGWVVQPGYEEEWKEHVKMAARVANGETDIVVIDGQFVEVDKLPTPELYITEEMEKRFIEISRMSKEDRKAALWNMVQVDQNDYADWANQNGICTHEFVEDGRWDACCLPGFINYKCTNCGFLVEQTLQPIHDLEVVEDVASSCTEQGYTISICSKCGVDFKEEKSDDLGHTPKKNETKPSFFKDGLSITTCSVCGEELDRSILPSTMSMFLQKFNVDGR